MLKRFNTDDAKVINAPIGAQLKLSSYLSLKIEKEMQDMTNVPYANGIGSIMYTMVCTRLDIACGVSLLSHYMSNPGRDY